MPHQSVNLRWQIVSQLLGIDELDIQGLESQGDIYVSFELLFEGSEFEYEESERHDSLPSLAWLLGLFSLSCCLAMVTCLYICMCVCTGMYVFFGAFLKHL